MKPSGRVIIRPIETGDHGAVAEIARRSFSVTQSGLVRPGPQDLVATLDGRVVGAVLLKVLELSKQGRVGRIAWLLTDPDYRGMGVARRLVKQGVERLRTLGCETVVTEVEGYNTPSANIFHELGFRRLGTRDQVRWLGAAGAVVFGVRTLRLFAPGHFLWALGVPGRPASPTVQRAGAWILNMLIALLALLLGGGVFLSRGPALPSVSEVLAVMAAVALMLGLREAAMRIVARAQGLKLEYRGWGSGAGTSALIAIFFGSVFPLPGGCYPSGDGWHYHQFRRALALCAAAGTALVFLVLIAAFIGLARFPVGFSAELAGSLIDVGIALLLFDSIIAVGPFQGYNARRMLDDSRPLWVVFASIGIVIYIVVSILG